MVREGMMLADRYEVISKIGAGGMSDVYKAKDHKLNRFVAVKVLKSEFSEDRNFVAKFRTEAQSAAALMHPNIVNVYDVGEEYGLYYIVMELVEGITLKHYIEKKLRLSVKEAISIAIQVSMGLEAAHSNHVIHRDVKPQNIIISKEGKVKVTDFGIARAATSDTITSNVMGSVHYASPEQARGGYSDEKSDIYSLGIVLFEMVTGRVPFDGETTVAIAIRQIQDPMPNPRDYVDDIPISVEHIIYKCCEKYPGRRYNSMTELIGDLKRSLISPNENFVKQADGEILSGSTKMVSDDEFKHIKEQTGQIDLDGDILKAYPVSRKRGGKGHRYEEEDIREAEETERQRPARKKSSYYSEEPLEDDVDDLYQSSRKGSSADKSGQNRKRQRQEEDRLRWEEERRIQEEERRSAAARRSERRRSRKYEEDDDEDDLDPRLQKVMTALGIIAAIIIVAIIIVLIGRIRSLSGVEPSDGTEEMAEDGSDAKAEVGSVVNQSFQDAKNQLIAKGLTVTSQYQSSDSVEKGIVMAISDEAGNELSEDSEVDVGSTVVLTVSSGADGTAVPSVVGFSRAEAKVTLENQGFQMEVSEAESDTVPAGDVISQSPEGGDSAASGSTVAVVISTGAADAAPDRTVPNLVGLTEIEAKASLAASEISFGEVKEENSATVAAGVVISQTPEAGQTVDDTTTVSFVVSKGLPTYGGSFSIAPPPDYVNGVVAQLVVTSKQDNSVLYNAAVNAFPATISLSGLTSSSGLLTINYTAANVVSYEADTGEIVTRTDVLPKVFTQDLAFTAE
ncbi:MAG: protein kinase [Lachnospiraceae bacterium]|nr:protein kinase [Lachnospiraceae bacterium]